MFLISRRLLGKTEPQSKQAYTEFNKMNEEFTELKSIPVSPPKTPTILTISQSLDEIEITENNQPKDQPNEDPSESVADENLASSKKKKRLAAK